jgi:putative transcriptional regulator
MPSDRLSNRIRRLRFDHGEMTQQQLADLAGVTRQTILAVEAGKYAPSLPLAFRIARAFGLPSGCPGAHGMNRAGPVGRRRQSG